MVESAAEEMRSRARARINELRQEIEKLEAFVGLGDATLELLNQPVLSVGRPEAESQGAALPVDESPKKARVTDNPKPAVVVDAAIAILRANRAPMSRRDLHAALAERGLLVRGANPVKALGTMLWRASDRIRQVEGQGYWPISDPMPGGSYLPSGLQDLLS